MRLPLWAQFAKPRPQGQGRAVRGGAGRQGLQMLHDMDALKREYGGGRPEFAIGSCLEILREIPDASFDIVITSPPYANRYDYTRTYALELAWLGYGQDDFSNLRQSIVRLQVDALE